MLNGSESRPPLPLELVGFICRLSEFYLAAEDYHSHSSVSVRASSAKLKKSLWLETRPLSRSDIYNTATIIIRTESRHQGWVSLPDQGSWSYFSLAILSPGGTGDVGMDRVRMREDGGQMMWTSHHNPVESRDWAFRSRTFDAQHEIWSLLRPGDSIGLVACAQFPGWRCEGREADITLNRFYDPPA